MTKMEETTTDLLALNASEEVVNRYRSLLLQSGSRAKWMDPQLLSSVASALLRPQDLLPDSCTRSVQEEWYENLTLQRKLIMWLLESASRDGRSSSSSSAEESTSNLLSGVLMVLKSEATTLSKKSLLSTIKLVMTYAPNEDWSVQIACVNLLYEITCNEKDDEIVFAAVEAILVIGERLGQLQALRVIPILLKISSPWPRHLYDRLALMDAELNHFKQRARMLSPRESYDISVSKSGAIAHFTLQNNLDLANKIDSGLGARFSLNLIGEVQFSASGASEGRRSGHFSPNSFIAMAFEDALNPPCTQSFSVEIWACLSLSCEGGVVVSSYTDEEGAPRGYRLECRASPNGLTKWTFCFGAYRCSGSSARKDEGNSVTERRALPHIDEKDEKWAKEKMDTTSLNWAYVVGSWDAEERTMLLYVNGVLVGSTKLSSKEIPEVNYDSPLYFGGGIAASKPHFYGKMHDAAFYSCALSKDVVARHYALMLRGVPPSREASDDESSTTDDDEDGDGDGEDVDFKVLRDITRLIKLVMKRAALHVVSGPDVSIGIDHELEVIELTTVAVQILYDRYSQQALGRSALSRLFCKEALLLILQIVNTIKPHLTSRMQILAVDITRSDDFDLSDQAARILALCRPFADTDAVSLTALALFLQKRTKQGRVLPDLVVQALFEVQSRAVTFGTDESWVNTYVESLLVCFCASLDANRISAMDTGENALALVVHSALCLGLGSGWIPSQECAYRCLELLCTVLKKEGGNPSTSVGGALDLAWTLVVHVCNFTFSTKAHPMECIGFAKSHAGAIVGIHPGELESKELMQLFDEVSAANPLPPMYKMRFQNRPSEGAFRQSIQCMFMVLVSVCVSRGDGNTAGLATRAYRESWAICNTLSSLHQKSELDYEVLAKRVVKACQLLQPKVSLQASDLVTFLAEPAHSVYDDDISIVEMRLIQEVKGIVNVLVGRDDCFEFVSNIAEVIRSRSAHVVRVTQGLEIISELLTRTKSMAQSSTVFAIANYISRRFISFDFSSLYATQAIASDAKAKLNDSIRSCLNVIIDGPGDTNSKLSLADSLFTLAPQRAFEIALEEAFAKNQPPSSPDPDRPLTRRTNDALDDFPQSNILSNVLHPSFHFVPCETSAMSNDTILLRGTHTMLAGKFYFEIAAEDKNETVLMHVGLFGEKLGFGFDCGCRLSVGSGFGLGILVDLDAGGMLSVFSVPEDDSATGGAGFNRRVILRAMRYQCIVPAKRPLFPVIRVLNSRSRIRASFALNTATQVSVDLDPTTMPVNSPRSTGYHRIISVRDLDNDGNEGEKEAEEEEKTARESSSDMDSANPDPSQQLPPSSRVSRSAGPLAEAFDTSMPELYACGQNAFGELGLGLDDKKSRKRLVESFEARKLFPCHIAAGNEFSGLISSEGLVYTWGMNTKGSCGQGLLTDKKAALVADIPIPSLVRGLQRKVVTRLCASNGCENMFAITNHGEAFAWGFNKFGQCGLGTVDEIVFTPTSLQSAKSFRSELAQVADVANGYSHTLILMANGELYSCGLNSKGQLGLGSSRDIRPVPQLVTALAQVNVTCIAVGALHSAIVDGQGRVWTFGKNDYGQLGVGQDISFADSPRELDRLKDVSKVACGYHFTVAIDKLGQMWTFGKNSSGELGLGHARGCTTPQLVVALTDFRIACVACGTGHWVAASLDGKVFACGRNKAGAIGDGTSTDRLVPEELQFAASGSAVQVAAGFHHTLVLCGQLEESLLDPDRQNPKSRADIFLDRCSSAKAGCQVVDASRRWMSTVLDGMLLGDGTVSEWSNQRVKRFWQFMVEASFDLDLAKFQSVVSWILKNLANAVVPSADPELATLWLEFVKTGQYSRHQSLSVEQMHSLLVLAGKRTTSAELAIASQAVHVVRALLIERLIDEEIMIDRFILDDSVPSDVLLGVFAVLGGELEVVRAGGMARLVAGEIDRGHSGTIAWSNFGSRLVAKLVLEDGEIMYAKQATDLIPHAKTPPPVIQNLHKAQKVLEKATVVAKGLLSPNDGSQYSQAESIAACKLVGTLLKTRSDVVPYFVAQGHLAFISSLLGTKLAVTAPLRYLERDYVHAIAAGLATNHNPTLIAVEGIRQKTHATTRSPVSYVLPIPLSMVTTTAQSHLIKVETMDIETGVFEGPSIAGGETVECARLHETIRFDQILTSDFNVQQDRTTLLDMCLLSLPSDDESLVQLVDGLTINAKGRLEGSEYCFPIKSFLRVVIVESSRTRKIFVNGQRVALQSMASATTLGDREASTGLGLDLIVSSIQIRRFAMSEDEVRGLGRPVTKGIPVPTRFDLANQLMDNVELPFVWCLKALEKADGDYMRALNLLRRSEVWLVRRGRAKAKLLSSLGFDLGECSRAVASTTSLMEAVSFLIDQKQIGQLTDRSAAQALSKISFVPGSSFQTKALGAMSGMVFSDRFVRAKEGGLTQTGSGGESQSFELAMTSKATAPSRHNIRSDDEISVSSDTFRPSAKTAASRFDIMQLFSAYARRATVHVLNADTKNAFLGSARQFFVRDYLKAFSIGSEGAVPQPSPASDMDIWGGESLTGRESVIRKDRDDEEGEAVHVLRSRLLTVVTKEMEDARNKILEATKSVDVSRQRWLDEMTVSIDMYQKPLPAGAEVWVIPGGNPNHAYATRLVEAYIPNSTLPTVRVGLLSPHKRSSSALREKFADDQRPEDDAGANDTMPINVQSLEPHSVRVSFQLPPRVVASQYLEAERRRAVDESEASCWKSSVTKSLLEILLSELALLANSTSHRMLETGLQVAPAHAFALAARTSQGDLSVWRPISAVAGYHSLGDVAESGPKPPSRIVFMASDDEGNRSSISDGGPPLLLPPKSFELVFMLNDNNPIRFWRPVPPSLDYVALGMLAGEDSNPPDVNSMRCVHVSCVGPGRLGHGAWSKEDAAQVWNIENQAGTFLVRPSAWNSSMQGQSQDEDTKIDLASPGTSTFDLDTSSLGGGVSSADDEGQAVSQITSSLDDEDISGLDFDDYDEQTTQNASGLVQIRSRALHAVVPLQLASSYFSAKSSSDVAFWILFLLVDISAAQSSKDNPEGFPWRERVFGRPLISVLLKLANESALNGVRALRALGAVTSSRILSVSHSVLRDFREEFESLRRKCEMMVSQESSDSRDPEFALFSSRVCALVEFLVSLNDTQESRTGRREFDESLPNTVKELSDIMDVLLRGADGGDKREVISQRFPDDFIMAEDTFLKLVRADDTAIVESLHPYSLEDPELTGKVVVDQANNLVVRFDRRSATSFGDGLSLQMPDADGNYAQEMLQGNFGGSIVRVSSNSLSYRFPVAQQMNWTLSPTQKGSNIRVHNGSMSAYMRKDKTWETIVATKGFSRGINAWECYVDRITSSSNIFFGVVGQPVDLDSYVGCDNLSWGWIGCLACWHGGRKVKHPFGKRLKSGDVVRITLDLHRRTLSIALNGQDQGVALDRLPSSSTLEDGKFYPAFSFYNKNDEITLLRGGVAE